MTKKTKYILAAVALVIVILAIVLLSRKKPVAPEIVLDDMGRVIPPPLPGTTAPIKITYSPSSTTPASNMFNTVEGKAAFAKRDNVTVYDSHSNVRRVVSEGDWVGTVIDMINNVCRIYFSDGTIGWVTKTDVYLS